MDVFGRLSSWTLSDVKTLTDILQNLALVIGAGTAAWWAYATFGLKEKNDELLAIARKINEINSHVDGSILMYGYRKVLVDVAGLDQQKLIEVKQVAEARFIALCEELSDMRDLSLRLPPAFRILTIGEYELVLLDLQIQGIEHWSNEELKTKLRTSKIQVLTKIYDEMNRHSSFLRWAGIKISNGIYHIKHIGTSKG